MIWGVGALVLLVVLCGPLLVRVRPRTLENARRRRREAVQLASEGAVATLAASVPAGVPRRAQRPRRMAGEPWWVLALFGLILAGWFATVAGWAAGLGTAVLVLVLAVNGPGRTRWRQGLAAALVFAWFTLFGVWWMGLVGTLFVTLLIVFAPDGAVGVGRGRQQRALRRRIRETF